jgi:hypothetical protein
MSKQSDAAYLAGFMDGEGSISIVKTYGIKRHVNGDKVKNIRFHLHMKIANTNRGVLDWICGKFGGQVYAKKECSSQWKPRFDWVLIGNKNMERVLLAILPYLHIKHRQALIALEFVRLHGQEMPEIRASLREKMLTLNNSGQSRPETPTTNMPNTLSRVKIESELDGDIKSVPMVT